MKLTNSLVLSIPILFIVPSAWSAPFTCNYELTGKVAGIVASGSSEFPCYIAINSDNKTYTDYYHAISNESECAVARLAYITGADVHMWGRKDTDSNNDAAGLELTKGPVKWWNPPVCSSIKQLKNKR